jgi:glycosyltransferase involved in cell wall biosynthesis
MKILYHHRTASKDGQAVHIEEMVHALRQRGHEVRVVAPAAAREHGMGGTVGWVQRLRQALPKAVYELLELAYSWVAYRRLAQAAREFQPDVLYERYNLFLLAGVLLRRRTGIPLLLEVNAPLADERRQFGGLGLPAMADWAERLAWRSADVVLPVTAVLADHVRDRGVPDSRIEVVPNGINLALFQAGQGANATRRALGWHADDIVLGFTGFVRDWHGVDKVVRWMAGGTAPARARLLMVGDGPARAHLESLAGQLKLGDRVHFTGVVDRSAVPALVAAFDIALQPAVVPYASPLKLFEYLALGKAIVAPARPNLLEVLEDGDNALLFDDARPGALEQALERLCGDEALRARLGAGAQATIQRRQLTWDGNAQRVGVLAAGLLRQAGVVPTRRGVERP